MRRLLFTAYLLIVACFLGSVSAEVIPWQGITTATGESTVHIITNQELPNLIEGEISPPDETGITGILGINNSGLVISDRDELDELFIMAQSIRNNEIRDPEVLMAAKGAAIYPSDVEGGWIEDQSGSDLYLVVSWNMDNEYRESFVLNDISGLANYNVRLQRYREMLRHLILQPLLREPSNEATFLEQNIKEILTAAEIGPSLVENIAFMTGINAVPPTEVDRILTAVHNLQGRPWLQRIGDIGLVAGALSQAAEVRTDYLHMLLLQSLALEGGEKRLEALEYVLAQMNQIDPALEEGFLLAKQDFYHISDGYYDNLFDAAIYGISNDPSRILGLAQLSLGIASHVVPALSTAGYVVGPYFLALQVLVSILEHQENSQLIVVAATFQDRLFESDGIPFLQNAVTSIPAPDAESVQHLLCLMNMNYYLGYYYYDRCLAVFDSWPSSLWGFVWWQEEYSAMIEHFYHRRDQWNRPVFQRTRDPYYYSLFEDPGNPTDPFVVLPWCRAKYIMENTCENEFSPGTPPISPMDGDRYTSFTFTAWYKNNLGIAATSVSFSIDGNTWGEMSGDGSSYSSGVTYTYSESGFERGAHTYEFKCIVDGCDDVILGPFGFTVSGPVLPPDFFVASPSTIDAGSGYSVLTATLLDDHGNPIVGEHIAIYQHPANQSASCGTIFDRNPLDSRTDENGVVTAKFRSSCQDDYVIIANPDNYYHERLLIRVEGEGCPFDVNPPRITVEQMCGSEVRLGLRPRFREYPDGPCIPAGNYLIWTASCPGAWFEDDGVNLGNPAIIETHGEMTCNIDIYLHYSGNPCDAVITVAVQDYPCEVSVTQRLDLECPPIIDPIFSFGSSDSDYEHGKRVQFSQDGSIVVGPGTNGCDIYETKNFTKITSRNAGSSLGLFALSPTADSLAMNDGNDRYYLFNLQTGETHVSDHELSFDPSVIIWSDNRDRIACTSYDNYNYIYILRPDGSTVATLNTGFPDDQVYDLSWRNGKLAAVSDSRRVHVWNAANDSYTKVWSYNDQAASGAEFYGCDFNSDATILAVIGYWDAYSTNSHNLYFFNTSSGSITNSTALGHPREWNDICWSPDDMKILAVGDQGAKILQASNLVPLLELNVSLTDATWCDWSIGDQISVVDASSVKLFTPFDISPPSIQSLSPQSGTIVTGPQIQVNGDIFDEFSLDPEDVEMNVNGGAWIDIFDTSWTFSENVPLDAGENSIAFRHADRMGNWGYDTLIVTRIVDNTGPVITNVLADNNIQVGSQVDISATVFDPWSGVDPDSVICILYDNLDFLIDSVRMSNAVDDTIFSCNWNSGGQCEGQIRIDIRAVDLQGNITLRSTAAYVNLFDFPQLQSVVIDPISPTDTTEPVIVASWTDCSDLSTAIVYFVFDDASANWQQRNMAVVDHSCNVTLPRKNTGWMYYSITLTDVYAHSSTSAVDSYFIADVSPPQTVSLYEPYNNKHVSDLRPTLSWQSTYDPGGSGVESYTVELANNSDFTGSQVTEVVGSASWKPIWDLAFGHYYWRVWATDNSENSGEMSSEWSFFVDDQAPLQPDSILVNGGMVPEWTNDSVFVIRYVESDIGFSGNVVSPKDMAGPLALGDTSGISLAYYKLGAPPSANDDFFGVSLFNPFSLVVQERDVLYVWLKDGAGNVDYQNWVSVDLLFDDDPVTGVEAILVSDTLSDAIGITWETGTDGSGSGTSDIYDIYVRIGTAGWQELAVGLDNVTEFDTIPNFSSGGTWIYFEVATRDQIGNYDSTGVAEDSIYHPLPTGVEDEGDIQLPVAFSLDQNYPNPFNPVTTISFSLPTASSVTLGVFNTLGQKVATVADGFYDAGIHAVEWDGSNASSGVYFYRIETNAFIETKKMVLMK